MRKAGQVSRPAFWSYCLYPRRTYAGGSAGTMLTALRPRRVPNSNRAADQREQRVVAAAANAVARVEVRAALADDDLARVHDLAAVTLDAEALGL